MEKKKTKKTMISLIPPTSPKRLGTFLILVLALSLAEAAPPSAANAQEGDPPARVARLGYMEGSVSFQPAGENEWVEAVPNRPMTTGDKLWADKDSRAEVQLGSATIDLAANTGFSFLNLDDNTVQIQLTAGAMNVRVRELDQGNVFEVDTPNQAFTVQEPGRYRVEASENGDYTVVTIRQGAGESTGNGQSYTLQAGQRTTFSGTTSLNAEVEQTGNPDDFDNWSDARYRRYDASPSARYCSRDMVGLNDLDRGVVTGEVLAQLGVAMTSDEWRDRLARSEQAGVTEVIYQPAGPDVERELTVFAQMAGLRA